ncbi:AAA ATPase midasin, partial [Coemansia sp. RSA 2618]
MGPPPVLSEQQQQETSQGLDLVKQGLEKLEIVSEQTTGAPLGKTLDESIRITDIDPLSVDLPLAITQLSAQLTEHSIEIPREAHKVVEKLARWAASPKRSTVGEVMDRVSALLLAEGLNPTAAAAGGLSDTAGRVEWTDGRFTVTVAMVFRPVLVDLVARWTLPGAPAAVFRQLGPDVVDPERVHTSVAYAAGLLLPTAPQIRSLVMAYFRTRVHVCIAEQALAASNADQTANVLVVVWRLLRRLPEALGVEAWGWEAPLAMLMGPQHADQVRLIACEVLCMVKAMSDHGRSQLLATLPANDAALAQTLAWLVHGEQHATLAAETQMHRQNATNYELRIWQGEESTHEWLSEAQLSSCVASVGGVLLHAHESARVTDDLVVTPMVARNIHAMALATSRSEPVLLQGPAGSGKTSLVEWVARRTGNELVTVHVSGNMDAKVLLGNYVTTQRAGDFEWRAGLLTTAVTEGSWVLIENIDLAPADVVQTLQPLIESHTLFVASRGQSIRAHEQFRLFATLSTDSRAMGRGDGLLGSSIWTRLEIGEIDSEMPAIVRGAFPKLADDAEALARAFRSIRDIVRGTGAATARGPVLSTRDLVKWCTRLSAYYAGDSFVVFQEAVDVFTLREADHERWRALVHSVGTALGVASPRVEQFLGQHSPTVVATGRSLRIGRATLPTEQAAERERMPFADTRHSRCLLERLATCVQLGEPALLMGETGTGKTTVVQHMAMLAGRSLSVFNLSQQSDASDLLGGFRPVDISRIALRLRESFDALFARTVSVRKNAAFLDRTRVAFGKRDWKRLSGLYRTALKNARQMLEVAHGQLQGAELNAKRQRLAATDAEPKKTRLTEAAVAELSVEWDAFAHRLDEFEAMKGAKMVFSFVEGALVRAARTGAWILLDEVNLATAETLACLGGLLQRERTLLLAETGARITCHADFRLFGCMNPATDVGKRDLPPALRSSFTELFVHAPDADAGDLLAIVRAHLPPMAPVQLCHRVIEFYGAAKDLAKAHALVDGAGQRPHYSLRTLTRSLTYARDHAATYSLRRALYDGLSMTFATQLEGATQAVLVRELHRVFEGDDLRQLLNRAPAAARGADAVLVQGFWLPAQESADAADAAQGDAYVVTRSVEAKLRALARAVMCGRYPVLIQGPTSAGKTSMVQHLARATGHTFVRINNHEHTDLQEYLGAYASVDGRLEFEEGLLVRALRHGHWLVLDELNLAPSDVLEALNRLLDDNRELVIPETQEVVRPHPHFMLFATQNPAGLYGGRKALSRAFRNRFVELHFDDIPEPELQQIIEDSSRVPPTHARLLVDVYRNLTQVRAQTRIFEASHGFITLRDLFRWANRHAASRDELAEHGYMLLAERVRTDDEKRVVQRAIERAFYAPKSEESSRACRRIDIDALYSEERVRKMPEFQALQGSVQGIAWTKAMRRLFVLTALCVRFNEPVLLVGDTGCGKTTVCQMLAQARGQQLRIVNCHQNTESSDILGSQRPVRNRAALLEQARAVLEPVFGSDIVVDSPAALQQLIAQQNVDVATFEEPLANAMALLERAQALFAWHDGPLVQALRNGDMFLMDELNLADDSVLERLNSVLEPARTLVLAENVGAAMVTARTGFGFVATMNPGGDYGKRELSPALRNRFTELWAPVTVDRDDLHMVLCARLGAIDARGECARVMLDFVAYLHDDARVLQHPLSLRDYLFWAEFVVGLHGVMDVRACVVHGACMVLLDGIGAQGSVFSVSTRAPAAVKAECVRQLRAMIGYADMSDLGVVPARDIMGSSDLPSAVVTHDGGRVGVRPFLVEAGADAGAADGFALHAPTTFDNLVKVLRAMQVGKPLLLEGSPGVGKTTLVSTLAKVAGHRLVRINLSDQTDLMDLFGTDLPVDDGFAWCDAPFLQALKRGDWVLLDEINLASQSVLEGLNSCLDHRGSVYISELDREFELSHGFRLFAAQNPLAQGGGRKGLPRSFVNRFSQVFMDELQRDDLQIICDGVYSAHPSIERVLEFNWRMHRATMTRREFGSSGAPWEFNLRDVSRFMELALGPSLLEAGAKPVDEYVAMLYVQRMRTIADRQHVLELFRQVFGRELLVRTPTLHVTFGTVQVGHAVLKRRAENARMTRLRALGGQLQYAESLMTCIERRWMAILVGGAGSGKTALVRWLAAVTGNHLVEFAMNAGVDTSEILGGFEQVDVQRHQSRLLRVVRELVDRLVVSCEFGSEERVRGAAQACALLQQARQAERDALPGVVEQIVSIARELQIASIDELIDASDNAARSFASLEAAGRFEWVDGVLVEALERGHWLLLDRANLCSASVLDRLNGLLEPNGVLYVNEDPKRTGPVVPHPDFRIIMAVDPQHGELSRAMRNRGIEICMLPPEDELCAVGDQMAVARTLGVGRELSQGVRRAEPSLAGLVQTAVHAAERVQRGYPAHVETADDSTAAVVLPGVQPGALDAAVAVAGWQAQLVSWATTEHAPAGVEPLVWPQRMLLAALSTVQPDVQSVESLVFQAICKREAQLLLNSANAIPLALVAVRRELAQTSHINTDVLLGAPVCASLNLGLHNALGRHTGTREARWHEALQASRMFELERLVTAAGQTCDADIGDLRELVLQRPNIDVPYVQSMFALLTGCATLQSDWESHVVSAASIERYDAAVDSVAFVRELRTVHAMKTRLHSLLEREHGAASEQAVALELMQGALHRLVRGPVRPGPLLELVNRLVLDATHSARMWALVHPVTLPDAHMRELEARLDAARLRGPDEQRAEAVEALAMLYAASARKNKDLIVAAVSQFAASLTEEEGAEGAIAKEVTPASVLADVVELRHWQRMLRLTVVAGSLPRDATAQRVQLIDELRQVTDGAGAAADSPWALLLTRLKWQANDGSASNATGLLSLFADAAYAWYGRLDADVFDASVDAPQHRLGRAVGTELAWRSAARLHCSLKDHQRAASESRALLHALAEFRPSADGEPRGKCAELVAMLLMAARAVGGIDVVTRASERLLAILCGSDVVSRDAVDEWQAELKCADTTGVLEPAVNAVRAALLDSRMASVWVAAVETSIGVLRVAVPGRAVDPAAKAYARWSWLGTDVDVRRADVAAFEAVQRSMTGEHKSAATEPLERELAGLERQRAEIELVYRPESEEVRFAELWHEAANLAQSVVGRVRDTAMQLADNALTSADDFTRVQAANEALQKTLQQFELRVEKRYFGAFRDQAQIWTLCSRQLRHALRELGELRRRAVRSAEREQAQLVCALYAQPMAGVPATRESNAQLQGALSQLKTLIYAAAGSPLPVYGELVLALLLRVVLGVQVRGVLAPADLEALDIILRDAYDIHKRAVDERRKREAEAASLFKFKASEDETDERVLEEIFPGFADVFEEEADEPAAPSFADIPDETVAAIAACHQYVMLQFGVLDAAPDVRSELVADAQRQALQLAASLYAARPELAAMATADADSALRGANVAALASVLRAATADAEEVPGAHVTGVRSSRVHDFYHDAWASEAVQLRPLALAIAERTRRLLDEWPEHAVLQQIRDMSVRLLELPVTTPLAKLLTGLEQLHERAQDWQAYASRDVSIDELHDAARLIIRWRQRELNSWPHLLRAQELEFARRPNQWWFSLFASLVVPETAGLRELVSAVDQFMQGSPAGEFRARLNMLYAFCEHRAALLAARTRQEEAHSSWADAKRTDSVYAPLANAISYYVQYAPCIASQLETAKQAVSKDLTQYVKISTWKDVNPAALRASAQKTHKHLAKCVRRWREALSQPIFQIIQAQQTNAIVTARVPQVQLVPLPLAGAGVDVEPPRALAAEGALAGASLAPWATNDSLIVDAEVAQMLAQRASGDAVAKVLAGCPATMVQLARLMAASPVFGRMHDEDAAAPTALEQFAVQIVSDVNYFQSVETPKHLVKKPVSETPAQPTSSSSSKKKRIIKNNKKQDAGDEPEYVEEDEERQRLLLRFWGDQRNLRRTRLKEIMKGLQEIGLKRHFRPIADNEGETEDGAGTDEGSAASKPSALTGLTSVLRQAPLDIDGWREAVLVAAAIAPESVHAGSARAQKSWQLADMGFFRLTSQLAQLRTAAFEEHSSEVSAQQVQHIVGLAESLNANVVRDRQSACDLLSRAAAWMQAAAPWAAVASGSYEPTCVQQLKPRVDVLVAQLEQLACAVRAVGDVGGWRDTAGVAHVQREMAAAATLVVQAQALLAT